MKKTIRILIFIISILIIMMNTCSALTLSKYEITSTDGPMDAGGKVIGVVTAAGMSISVITIILVAIRYMIASADEKADLKKSAIFYVTGAIIFFAASIIVKIIAQFSQYAF